MCLLVDAERGIDRDTHAIVKRLVKQRKSADLVLNKIDLVKKPKLLELTAELNDSGVFSDIFMISAEKGDGVPDLMAFLCDRLPLGPWLFPEDQISDMPGRLTAAEITREQLYRQLHEELPYDSAVRPELYQYRPDGSLEIHQQIVVARETQRGIVLGKGGSRIKQIGQAAREELSELLGQKVHLFLHVKTDERWSEDKEMFEEMGLEWKS